jgi:hypothetical protein
MLAPTCASTSIISPEVNSKVYLFIINPEPLVGHRQEPLRTYDP